MNNPGFPSRYEYAGKVFSGGQGDVYICRDKFLDRPVAIKMIRDPANVDDLRNEISSLKNIESRHIALIYDFVVAGNSPGIVQEYVPGESLDKYNFSSGDVNAFVKVLYQIASGISEMHKFGKIHRDIKPHNIKTDAEGVVKILDFGLSSNIFPQEYTHLSRGTPGFRAPELYSEPPVPVTMAVDVFAFGASVWFMSEKTLPEVLLHFPKNIDDYSPPSFDGIGIRLQPQLISLLNKTLELDPKNRPNIEEVQSALKGILLYGRHRAECVSGVNKYSISRVGESINITNSSGSIVITYNGFEFNVSNVSGDVYINNLPAQMVSTLPGPCVITVGNTSRGAARLFLPFNISHPEVVL